MCFVGKRVIFCLRFAIRYDWNCNNVSNLIDRQSLRRFDEDRKRRDTKELRSLLCYSRNKAHADVPRRIVPNQT